MRSRRIARRLAIVLLTVAAMLSADSTGGQDRAPEDSPAKSVALLAVIEGPIGPGATRHVDKAVEAARDRKAEVLILRINTPGGLATSMREIIAEILGSSVPVVGYVAPPGAHAASAGTYILYATHVAAMAPGTNLGAATPVRIGGGMPGRPQETDKGRNDPGPEKKKENAKDGEADETLPKGDQSGGAMERKATNDAVAFIRSLAEMHGRNADWAEKAVREAASLSATKALEMRVVDIVAEDTRQLLTQADGRRVTAGSRTRTLDTEGIAIQPFEADWLTRVLGILSNPNVALILMMIGVYGLIFEFSNPGSIGPGVVGVICLVLGLYALNQLPIDYAGLALIILGIAFMVAEAVTPTFGVLGAGGLVAFVVGAALLIDTEAPAYQISWWTIGGMAAASGAVLILLMGYVWRVYRRPAGKAGRDIVGSEGQVLDWSGTEGYVWARSERWSARGDAGLREGQSVRVLDQDGLTLVVRGTGPPAAPPEPTEGG